MQTTHQHKSVVEQRKRPDLSEVVRSLRLSGRYDVATTIAQLAGISEADILELERHYEQQQKQRLLNKKPLKKLDHDRPRSNNAKYYIKFRSAYLYVNSTTASMDDQSKMLHGFLQLLKKRGDKTTHAIIAKAELVPVTLPKNIVVLAIRMPLQGYQASNIPKYVASNSFMRAYLRKPRADTQHLAAQAVTEFNALKQSKQPQLTKQKLEKKA